MGHFARDNQGAWAYPPRGEASRVNYAVRTIQVARVIFSGRFSPQVDTKKLASNLAIYEGGWKKSLLKKKPPGVYLRK